MRLIKTAIDFGDYDENQDNVLLGDWCLKNVADILGDITKYNKIPYHWDDREKYARDYLYLNKVYEETLLQLVLLLNEIHSTNHNLRYWRIVIGPWLRYFIDVLFDRYECVKQAKEIGRITKSTIYPYDLDDVCPASFDEFWSEFTTDEWNEIVFSECLLELSIPYSLCNDTLVINKPATTNSLNFFDILKDKLKSLGNIYSKLLGRLQSGPVIINAYTSFYKVIKFQLQLKQLPYLFNLKPGFVASKKDLLLREKFSKIFVSSDQFECLLARLIPLFMPKSYIEDFLKLRRNALNTLPKNPKSIFTANAYLADEVFKIWAAEKTSQGIPLIIGQHGGNFGMVYLHQSEEHQVKIADNFASWGWEDKMKDKIISLPSFQLSGRAPINPNFNGSILHVLSSLPRYFYQYYSMPVSGQFLLYIKSQIKFLNKLEIKYLDNVIIRLDASASSRAWDIPKALAFGGFSKYIDTSNDSILALLSKSRLCVCTHNATVFLETLALNFPTVIFWEPSHNEMRTDATPFFDILVEAGILFYTPEAAAKKVNIIEHNVEEWWFSEQVQSARQQFCQRYARVSTDWAHEWSDFLLKLK